MRRRRLATFVALALVLMVALGFRLPNLSEPNDNYDEGVYLESLLMIDRGYRPFSDIISTQGPLHLYVAYVPYALGGHTLEAARAGSVIASLVGLIGVAWAGGALGGPIGGVGAALTLGLGPTYLGVSRQALPEAPAVALSALSVGAAAWAGRTDEDRMRLLAGGLLGLACLVKPVVEPAALAVAVLAASRRSLRSSLLGPVVGLAVGGAGLLIAGPGEALGQLVSWRLAGQELDLAVVQHNTGLLADKMFHQERPGFYALAAVGALALLARTPRAGLAVLGWLVIELGLLLAYTDLKSHLGVTLVAPLAILAGAGLATGASAFARRWSAMTLTAALVTLWYAASIPAVLDRDERLVEGRLSTDRDGTTDEVTAAREIAALTDDDDFVLTDEPYLAFLAGRKVPPTLIDPSDARIRAGALTAEQLASTLRLYDPDVVVLWTGKLARFESLLLTLADDFEPVAQFGVAGKGVPRVIYRERVEEPETFTDLP